jgi:ABC-type branched-subunit amino acid transport system substrate-binding protein
MKNFLNSKKALPLAATLIAISAILIAGANSALAQNSLNEADFKIKDFGIKDGKPWLSVEGKAGASKPQNASQIFAYVFVTDKGIFAVTSHGTEDSSEVANDTQWHSHGVVLSDKNCVTKLNEDGDGEVNDMVGVANTNATKVDKVMTALLGINNADAKVCVEKVFDSKP